MGQRPARILVVDDDPGIRHMLLLTLRESGHDVRAVDGRGRIDVGDAELVVIDFRLGDRTATDVLCEQPELARLPLIVMTATTSPHDTVSGLPPGAEILPKPFDLDSLDEAIALAPRRSEERGAETRAGASRSDAGR